MASNGTGGDGIREVVALFETRAAFDAAVEALLAAGFRRSDLSVLSSHESIEAASRASRRTGRSRRSWAS